MTCLLTKTILSKIKMADHLQPVDEGYLQAVEFGNLYLIESFLNQGANINVENKNGLNALHIALNSDDLQSGHLLLERGVNLWALDGEKNTILMKSIKLENRAWTEMIIKKGLTVHEPNEKNYFLLLSNILPITRLNQLLEQVQSTKLTHPLLGESLIRIALRAGLWNAAHLLSKFGGKNMLNEALVLRKSLCKEVLDTNNLHLIQRFIEEGYKLNLTDMREALTDPGLKNEIKAYLQPIVEELAYFHTNIMGKTTAYDFLFIERHKLHIFVDACALFVEKHNKEEFKRNNPNFGFYFWLKLEDAVERKTKLGRACQWLVEVTGQCSSTIEDLLFSKLSTYDLSKF